MALDIPAIAANGVNTAWTVAASALKTVTFRDGPTITRNPTTQVETVVWTTTITATPAATPLKALLWNKKQERGEAPPLDATVPSRTKMAMLRASDLPGVTEISIKAELVEGTKVWKVLEAETPPGEAIHLLRLRE